MIYCIPCRIHRTGIFTCMKTHKNQPNVGKYIIHGSYRYITLVITCELLGVVKNIEKKKRTAPKNDPKTPNNMLLHSKSERIIDGT